MGAKAAPPVAERLSAELDGVRVGGVPMRRDHWTPLLEAFRAPNALSGIKSRRGFSSAPGRALVDYAAGWAERAVPIPPTHSTVSLHARAMDLVIVVAGAGGCRSTGCSARAGPAPAPRCWPPASTTSPPGRCPSTGRSSSPRASALGPAYPSRGPSPSALTPTTRRSATPPPPIATRTSRRSAFPPTVRRSCTPGLPARPVSRRSAPGSTPSAARLTRRRATPPCSWSERAHPTASPTSCPPARTPSASPTASSRPRSTSPSRARSAGVRPSYPRARACARAAARARRSAARVADACGARRTARREDAARGAGRARRGLVALAGLDVPAAAVLADAIEALLEQPWPLPTRPSVAARAVGPLLWLVGCSPNLPKIKGLRRSPRAERVNRWLTDRQKRRAGGRRKKA